MEWCELTILAGASSLSDVSNVITSTILDRAGAGSGRRHGGGEGGGEGHHRKLHEAAAPLPGGGRCGHEEPDVSVAVLLLQTKLRI